mgnify:CR=1 FL=1
MAGFTNKSKMRLLETLRGVSLPTSLYAVLCTSATSPTQDTNTLSQLTQISGNGYTTNGTQLTLNTTNFTSPTEDDSADTGELTIIDMVWTASGGTLGAARWMVLTDDDGTAADREIWAYYDLGSDVSVSSGQTLTLTGYKLKLTET